MAVLGKIRRRTLLFAVCGVLLVAGLVLAAFLVDRGEGNLAAPSITVPIPVGNSTNVPPAAGPSSTVVDTAVPPDNLVDSDDEARSERAEPEFGPATAEEAFREARWVAAEVVNFVTDTGVALFDETLLQPHDLVQRAPDGTLYFLIGGHVVSLSPDAPSPVDVSIDGLVTGIIRTTDQDLVAVVDGGGISLPSGASVDFDFNAGDETIVASNGMRVVKVSAVLIDGGHTLVEPGRVLLFDAQDELIRSWPIGSPANPMVDLVDFDGERILVARRPIELAYEVEYFVIDTQCASCVEVLRARRGGASLAGPDVATAPRSFDVETFEPCPTWRDEPDIETPPDLPDAVQEYFETLVEASSRCDRTVLPIFGQQIEYSDGYRWDLLRQLLQSEPVVVDGEWEWTSTDAIGRESSIRVLQQWPGSGTVELWAEPDPNQLSVVLTSDWLIVRGEVDPISHAELEDAATTAAIRQSVDLKFLVSADGPELEQDVAALLGEFINTAFGSENVLAAEAQLVHGELRVWSIVHGVAVDDYSLTDAPLRNAFQLAGIDLVEAVDPVGVSAADLELVTQLRAVAGPPDDVVPLTGFWEQVYLGLGPNVVANRRMNGLTVPGGWTLHVDDYAAFVGPFSVMDHLRGGQEQLVTLGPHDHCAGTPRAAPFELAGMRRVSIQPETFTSCIEWWTVDLFLDSAGFVRGVILDIWEP